jgi:hypothetical protein
MSGRRTTVDRTTERHPLDLFSLLAGMVFVGIGVVFLVDESAGLDLDVGWVLAALLVGLGLAGALGTLTRRRTPSTTAETADEATAEAADEATEDHDDAEAVTS